MKTPLPMLLVVMAMMLLPAHGSAQTLSVRGGASISTLGGDGTDETESLTGLTLGGFLTLGGGPVGLQIGASYIQKGAEASGGGLTGKLSLDYVELPVLLRLSVPSPGLGIHFYGGPALSFEIACEVSFEGFGESAATDCSDADVDTKSVDFGLLIGAGVDLSLAPRTSLTLDAFYGLGLTNIDDSDGSESLKNRSFSLVAGLSIHLL